jgi:very-short-patch-repair endonuclease
MHVDQTVDQIAGRQHGLVTREQLLGVGLSPSSVSRRVNKGRLVPIHRAVFRVGPVAAPRSKEMAAVLSSGSRSVVSHTSALALWGVFQTRNDEPVHVTRDWGGRLAIPNVIAHRSSALADDERTSVDGVPVTSLARSLVDAASLLRRRQIINVIGQIEREALLTRSTLLALQDRYAGWRGMAAVREVLSAEMVTEFTRSEAERVFFDLIRKAGLPLPASNVSIGPYEIDFFWSKLSVAFEVDGFAFHGHRKSFEADRRKDNVLRSRGIIVGRLTWAVLTREPFEAVAVIAQTLAEARLRAQPAI